MNQGTKVGLLVSLAFLIAIFVLLSDHVASTQNAKPAQITVAGPQVNKSTATPGTQLPTAVEPPASAVAIAPQQTLPTGNEITRAAAPTVNVGPVTNGTPTEISANNRVQTTVFVAPRVGEGAHTMVFGETPRVGGPIGNDPLISPGSIGGPAPMVATAPKNTEHKALPGDTVSKMARKYYGSDTKANRDLIINANKSLKGDPTRVEVGKVYAIPPKPTPAAAAPTAPATPAAAVSAGVPAASLAAATTEPSTPTATVAAAAVPAAAERTYMVKQGDNLWKIAKEQCKDANAVDQIKKLNRDVLKNGIDLKVGTKLRLPPAK